MTFCIYRYFWASSVAGQHRCSSGSNSQITDQPLLRFQRPLIKNRVVDLLFPLLCEKFTVMRLLCSPNLLEFIEIHLPCLSIALVCVFLRDPMKRSIHPTFAPKYAPYLRATLFIPSLTTPSSLSSLLAFLLVKKPRRLGEDGIMHGQEQKGERLIERPSSEADTAAGGRPRGRREEGIASPTRRPVSKAIDGVLPMMCTGSGGNKPAFCRVRKTFFNRRPRSPGLTALQSGIATVAFWPIRPFRWRFRFRCRRRCRNNGRRPGGAHRVGRPRPRSTTAHPTD